MPPTSLWLWFDYYSKSFPPLFQYFHRSLTCSGDQSERFSAFLKPVIPQLNLCSAHSILPNHHSRHFKCPCIFNFISYTKRNTVSLIHFFRIVKNRRSHQNTTNLFICQKQNAWYCQHILQKCVPTYLKRNGENRTET